MKFIFWLLRKLERFKCPCHKLSDFFAILGLGALQKEEQNKNLHKPPDSQLPPPPASSKMSHGSLRKKYGWVL